MKVCFHNGILVAVLVRDEHCPPHVHVGDSQWDARFEFGFWHQGVRLMDVTPSDRSPKASTLEVFRGVIKDPKHLRKARELWWRIHQSICLDNQCWDPIKEQVVEPKKAARHAQAISSAHFDPERYSTILRLAGESDALEIAL
jgi:hypothetical protein